MASRKSRRQQEEEKKQQRMKLLIGIFFIGLMVVSTVAFVVVFYADGNQQNGYDFAYEIQDDQLIVRTSEGLVPFYNFPDQRFTLNQNVTSLLQDAEYVVIAVDPEDNESLQYGEFVRFDLSQYMQVRGAKTKQSNNLAQFPVVSCSDATVQAPIVIMDANATGVSVNNSCLTFGARGIDALFVRDAILYSYFDLL